MSSKIKTIIIIVVIIAAAVVAYILFFQKAPEQGSLTSSNGATPLLPNTNNTTTPETASTPVDPGFLATLLSVKSLTINDSIFSSIGFINLRDSSIPLIQDNTEGRVNPFAPIGSDTTFIPVSPDLSPSDSSSQTNGTGNITTGNQSNGLPTPKKN